MSGSEPKNGESQIENDLPNSKKYTVIRIACPVDAEVKLNEETLSNKKESLAMRSSFGRMDILGEKDDIKMFCIDSDAGYDIQLNGTGTGKMDYTIRFFNEEGELEDERNAIGVPITPETKIKTTADQSKDTVLFVDKNGDGVTDDTWTVKPKGNITESDKREKDTQKAETNVGGYYVPASYFIEKEESEGGKISLSEEVGMEGMDIKISASSETGYHLSSLTVTKKDGTTVPLIEKDGVYVFKMPGSSVKIKAVFEKEMVKNDTEIEDDKTPKSQIESPEELKVIVKIKKIKKRSNLEKRIQKSLRGREQLTKHLYLISIKDGKREVKKPLHKKLGAEIAVKVKTGVKKLYLMDIKTGKLTKVKFTKGRIRFSVGRKGSFVLVGKKKK